MKLFDVMINTRYELIQGNNVEIKNVTIDSRCVTKGSMFFCIKGFHTDGHTYIKDAVKQGAVAIVVEELQNSYPENIAVLKVENSREALAFAAANIYNKPSESFNLIGVTGTNGKTSTTYFMEAILKEYGEKTGIIGTVETRIGNESVDIHFATSTTPDTVELQKIFAKMRDENVKNVVMEVTSHALALNKVDGVRYKVGIFTNLTQDHLDLHKTMEEYKKTKAKLFKSCEYGIFNADDDSSEYMIKNSNCKAITYSIDKPSDLQATNVKFTENGIEFDLNVNGNVEKFVVNVRGKFTVYNVLGTIGGALAMHIPVEVIKNGLLKMNGVPGRIQNVKNDKGFNVIVDYAHTPDGLINILSSVREFTKGRLITVFGCGGDRDRKKRPIMGKIAGELSDYCIITSDNPRTENPQLILDEIEVGTKESNCKYEKIIDRKEAITKAIEISQKGDTVVIAGKGHENYQIFAEQTIHFDDCEVAEEALKNI